MSPLFILLAVLVLFVFWIIGTYNGLMKRKIRVDESWSDIDVQLKRRYDLIPNLIETVKGYMAHERGTLEAVIAARQQAVSTHDSSAGSLKEQLQAENAISGTLRNLFALSENYPALKANENFARLQDELSDTENKIQAARRFYNGNVRDYNTGIKMFPASIIAGAFNFTAREFFEMPDVAQREPIQVKF